ncbi:MAG: hypothetical protein IRZ08_18905, partial [Frankia sp.]|nr:hypothetical protein [Frankia sp.]
MDDGPVGDEPAEKTVAGGPTTPADAPAGPPRPVAGIPGSADAAPAAGGTGAAVATRDSTAGDGPADTDAAAGDPPAGGPSAGGPSAGDPAAGGPSAGGSAAGGSRRPARPAPGGETTVVLSSSTPGAQDPGALRSVIGRRGAQAAGGGRGQSQSVARQYPAARLYQGARRPIDPASRRADPAGG